MKLKKLLTFAAATTFSIAPIITLVACSQTNLTALNTAIKNKETFVAYLGISNCGACQKLEPVWNRWTDDENWAESLKAFNKDNLNIKRYKFSAGYDFQDKDAIKKFGQTKWVQGIIDYVKKQHEELRKNDINIRNSVSETYTTKINGFPLLIFVKNGEYRWFTPGWGDAVLGNDLLKSDTDFRANKSFNESTLTRLVRDFILRDTKNFYAFDSSS